MSKILKVILIFFGVIFILFVVCRFSGMLTYYKISTTANEPNIKKDGIFLTSNLIEPKLGNFITYQSNSLDSIVNTFLEVKNNGSHYIHRLVAREGDIVEMKNGICFVNKKNIDENINLIYRYKITKQDLNSLPEEALQRNDNLDSYPDSVLLVFLSDSEIEKYCAKLKLQKNFINDSLHCFSWLQSHNGWTESNFGPLTIPKNKCFVLGDNRLNSMDSRFFGFVDCKKIKGVKL